MLLKNMMNVIYLDVLMGTAGHATGVALGKPEKPDRHGRLLYSSPVRGETRRRTQDRHVFAVWNKARVRIYIRNHLKELSASEPSRKATIREGGLRHRRLPA
jgi:hypothetical protein